MVLSTCGGYFALSPACGLCTWQVLPSALRLQDGGLVELKDSKLAGVFGYVPQQMFDFDPEWWVLGFGGSRQP